MGEVERVVVSLFSVHNTTLPETGALEDTIAGAAGKGLTVIKSVCAADVPQALLAATVMFPPLALAVAFIELVVEVPVHPLGSNQV